MNNLIIVSLIMLGVSVILFVFGYKFISQRELRDAVLTVGAVCLSLAIYVSGQGIRELQAAKKVQTEVSTTDTYDVETSATEYIDG